MSDQTTRKHEMSDRVAAQIETMLISSDVATLSRWHKIDHMTCLQAAILLLVQDNPGCTTGALAEVLRTSKPAITRATTKLCQLRMLVSETHYEDRRLVQLYVAKDWEGKL